MPKKESSHQTPSGVTPHSAAPVSARETLYAQTAMALQRIQSLPRNNQRPQDILALQRTAGNRAVQRMLAKSSAPSTPLMQRAKKEDKRRKKLRDRLRRTNERNASGKAIPKNKRFLYKHQVRHNYGFNDTKIRVKFVKGEFRRGWGQQPFLSLNKEHYHKAVVKSDYDSLIAEIVKYKRAQAKLKIAQRVKEYKQKIKKSKKTQSEIKKAVMEIEAVKNVKAIEKEIETDIAKDTLGFIMSGQYDKEKYTPEMDRTISTLVQLTQFIEPHENRIGGVDKLARASFRKIGNGNGTFQEEFNREDGNFVVARAKGGGSKFGGQDAGRALFDTERKKSDKAEDDDVLNKGVYSTIDEMSDSSDEESSDSDESDVDSDDSSN